MRTGISFLVVVMFYGCGEDLSHLDADVARDMESGLAGGGVWCSSSGRNVILQTETAPKGCSGYVIRAQGGLALGVTAKHCSDVLSVVSPYSQTGGVVNHPAAGDTSYFYFGWGGPDLSTATMWGGGTMPAGELLLIYTPRNTGPGGCSDTGTWLPLPKAEAAMSYTPYAQNRGASGEITSAYLYDWGSGGDGGAGVSGSGIHSYTYGLIGTVHGSSAPGTFNTAVIDKARALQLIDMYF